MKNLALTWRPARFEDVAGQEMVVRLLRNSLYKNRLFPAYLFMGQRGSGKTTIARIFAAALNCSEHAAFLANPKSSQLPCGACVSCQAMSAGQHPDFIEIDAASHTGVDDVRGMMETIALLPQIGRKRVYLIDEAHMLSKAAANALLKTLEEPPLTVVFLLATTDAHKIIDTVRSRCFPLLLRAHTDEITMTRLAHICQQENIPYTDDGLRLIARSADGSLRDALNMVEQALLAYERVGLQEVQRVLGSLSGDDSMHLLRAIMLKQVDKVMTLLQHDCNYDPRKVLSGLIEGAQALLWIVHHRVKVGWEPYEATLRDIAQTTTVRDIAHVLTDLFSIETVLIKSLCQRALFETALVKMCHADVGRSDTVQQLPPEKPQIAQHNVQKATSANVERVNAGAANAGTANAGAADAEHVKVMLTNTESANGASHWDQALRTVAAESDNLQLSIVQQLRQADVKMQGNRWSVAVSSELSLWHDAIIVLKQKIEKILLNMLQQAIVLDVSFVQESRTLQHKQGGKHISRSQKIEHRVDMVAQEDKEMVRKVLEVFPGTVSHTKGSRS